MERADTQVRHVLAIDDHQDTLALYRDALEEEGYRVTCDRSPHLEPEAVAALVPDLILLDLVFDRETRGVSFLERLKGDPETQGIPVLICSADHRLLERIREQLAAWDCGVLAKPFGLAELLAEIEACLANEPSPLASSADRRRPVDGQN